jgi:glycosyltransferase involved in cell wall biosynthesis
VNGTRDYVTDGVDGLLVPPGDPVALAAALERVAGDEALARRLGVAARRRAEQELSPERFLAALVGELRRLGVAVADAAPEGGSAGRSGGAA